MSDYKERYNFWCTSPIFNEETHAELKNIKDEKEIEDRFYKDLSFGTGGLRGVIGAGTNRMNLYTVGKASQGLSDFINENTNNNGSVVISFDSRNMSKEFALESAKVFAGNGIMAYLFDSLRPTPELSFSVRALKTTAGIEITASHNPPEYNGYKVYWSDGAQIVPPYDKLIIDKVNSVNDFSLIKRLEKDEAIKKGLLTVVGKDLDDLYINELKKLVINPDIIKKFADKVKIVYTPLCGTGKVPVLRVLSELGFKNVWTVKEQTEPNGDFPTLKYPNPEDPDAFSLAIKLAKEVDADIIMATDPDADRLGIYAKTSNGEYMPFTGNMSGLLLLEYELSAKKEKGLLPKDPKNGAVITTIVSSNMAFDIAKEYNVSLIEVLTGFKYIGEQIKLFENAIKDNDGKLDYRKYAYEYLFGFEESYGCLIGTHARDKDAIIAVTVLAEATCYYLSHGITLAEQMQNIYKKYGYYKEVLLTKVLKGIDGATKIQSITEKFRKVRLNSIGGEKVVAKRDYLRQEREDYVSGVKEELTLPKSNVIYYELENNGWCCVRPSGTEPKIKFYVGVKASTQKQAEEKIGKISEEIFAFTDDNK